jgi:hypothetical protein
MSLLLNPLLHHVLVETPACLAFFLKPSATLSAPAPTGHGVIRQYAVALLSTNFVALSVLQHDPQALLPLSKAIALSLALYHFAPAVRASSKLSWRSPNLLQPPFLFLLVHIACAAGLLRMGLSS